MRLQSLQLGFIDSLVELTSFMASPSTYTKFWSAMVFGAVNKNNAAVMWKSAMLRISVKADITAIVKTVYGQPKSSCTEMALPDLECTVRMTS